MKSVKDRDKRAKNKIVIKLKNSFFVEQEVEEGHDGEQEGIEVKALFFTNKYNFHFINFIFHFIFNLNNNWKKYFK